MKINNDHRLVLDYAFQILESCGDDTWMDIQDNPKLRKAYKELLAEALKKPKKSKVKEPKIPIGAIRFGKLTSKDILNNSRRSEFHAHK